MSGVDIATALACVLCAVALAVAVFVVWRGRLR
jgi:hypothetical protein